MSKNWYLYHIILHLIVSRDPTSATLIPVQKEKLHQSLPDGPTSRGNSMSKNCYLNHIILHLIVSRDPTSATSASIGGMGASKPSRRSSSKGETPWVRTAIYIYSFWLLCNTPLRQQVPVHRKWYNKIFQLVQQEGGNSTRRVQTAIYPYIIFLWLLLGIPSKYPFYFGNKRGSMGKNEYTKPLQLVQKERESSMSSICY